MSALGEKTFMLLLTDTEALEVIVKDGVNPLVIPTPVLRPVVGYALDYYRTSAVAPSVAVLKERFGDVLSDNQIDLDEDVEETIEWAITDLKQSYIQMQVGTFARKLATEVQTALPEDRLDVLGSLSSELSAMVLDLQPRDTRIDIRESGPELLREYEEARNSEGVRGMCLGIPEIDQHLGGIWEGELCTFAGPAGTGKSFLATTVAKNEWQRGRNTTIFTLENSISMTRMRIACAALQMNIEDMQTGNLPESEYARLQEWVNDELINSDTPLNIISPDMVNRSPQALVQIARAFETESLIVDQLTHIAAVDSRAQDRRNEVATIVRTLEGHIKTGRHKMPCLLLHQVNREGIKAAAATGRISMIHMAEAAEVERASSVVMTLYQSEEMRNLGLMEVQMLKQRRVRPRDWRLNWHPYMGVVDVMDDVNFDMDAVLGGQA